MWCCLTHISCKCESQRLCACSVSANPAEATRLEHLVAQLAGVGVVRAKAGAAKAAGGGRIKAGAGPSDAAGPEVVALLHGVAASCLVTDPVQQLQGMTLQ